MGTEVETKNKIPFKDTEEGKAWKPIEIDGIQVLAKRDKDAPSNFKWSIVEADTGLSIMPPSWSGGESAGTLEGAKDIVQREVIDKKGKDEVLRMIQDTREEMGIKPSPVTPEVKGFRNITDVPFYDTFLKDPAYAKSKGYEIEVVRMSPDEYLTQTAEMQGTSVQRQIEMASQDLVDKYAGMMAKGTEFDMPYLDFKRGEQEGRARALAAKKLGYKEIPVLLAKAPVTPKPKVERGKAKLIRIHAKRSPLSRASDERQKHQVTIEPDSPRVKQWLKDPGTADISGVDTPRLGRKTPRITKPTPRLKR